MSEKDNHSEGKKGDNVCRDFLRNVCRRGDRCKFSHPGGDSGGDGGGQGGGAKLQDKMEFCHDFQNNRCNRSQCRFIHCPADVETEFNKSGSHPPPDQLSSRCLMSDHCRVSAPRRQGSGHPQGGSCGLPSHQRGRPHLQRLSQGRSDKLFHLSVPLL